MSHAALPAKIENATDQFIAAILPAWLKRASAEQLIALRDAYTMHMHSQAAVAAVFARLQPLQQFAKKQLETALETHMALPVDLDKACWRELRRKFTVRPDRLPIDESYYVSEPAMQRLMQNFASAETFYKGSGLLYPAQPATGVAEQVVSDDTQAIVDSCRQADVGNGYQTHLTSVFDADAARLLAQDARCGWVLAARLAQVKRLLPEAEVKLLLDIAAGSRASHPDAGLIRCGELTLLDSSLSGVWVVEMRGHTGWLNQAAGLPGTVAVLLLMPDDEQHPVHHFSGWSAVNDYVLQRLGGDASRSTLVQRVALEQRAAFITTLQLRLADTEPDLEPDVSSDGGELFTVLASRRINHIKSDARFLAVPNAAADSRLRARRMEALKSAGLNLLNLAGLFVPVVGTLLLADMVRQTLGQLCEGVHHWLRGHQHEALQHLLGVAETLAVNAAIAGGAKLAVRSFARSGFVEQLEPVTAANGQPRLWNNELEHYRDTPPDGVLLDLDNGLVSDGDGVWWQHQGAHYRVDGQVANGPWRLRDPGDASAFGPALEFNDERAWRLEYQRPITLQGDQRLLESLWPGARALSGERQAQVLQVAQIDELQLRGLLVENRQLPVALRDTLERFAVQARIEQFFSGLAAGASDTQLWQYCVDQVGLQSLEYAAQAQAIGEQARSLRPRMLEHFARLYLTPDPALQLVQRDFPGLPDAYALHVLKHISAEQRMAIHAQQRLPLSVAQHAREMLQVAQLTRMREGLFLLDSYRVELVELLFALLHRHVAWPPSPVLELRDGTIAGRLLARLQAPEAGEQLLVMIRSEGSIRLYDSQGVESTLAVAEPRGLFEALFACTPALVRTQLGLPDADGAQALRLLLRQWLPTTRDALLQLLGKRDVGAPTNPLQRLPDGRLGYLLSGRHEAGSPSHAVLRRRVGALYPGFDDAQVDSYVTMLLEQPEAAYSALLVQEQQYSQLKQTLALWVGRARTTANADARREAAQRMRRCWRLIGERIVDHHEASFGLSLNLTNLQLRSLPDLSGGIDFSHVGELVLMGLALETVPQGFLNCFQQLRWLNLSNNALRQLPGELDRLRHLRNLQISGNQISLTATGVSMLRSLTQLESLDLSHNPLGAVSLQLRPLVHLRQLNLRAANLQAVPVDLDWCGLLEVGDLRNNHISTLPQGLRDAPQQLREALQFEGNPLPDAEQLLMGLPPVAGTVVSTESARELWLRLLPEQDRQASGDQWDALVAEPASADFFRLLGELTGTSDYRLTQADLGRRVWVMLVAASENTELRGELFTLAADPRTCVDSVASCFSALEVRLYIAQTLGIREPVSARAARLQLARRLFRLDQVEALARDEVERRLEEGEQVDEVEVSLAYRSGLAQSLELPGQPATMQFGTLAGVTLQQLNEAGAAVRQAEASDALAVYISQRDFWLESLRREHGPAFSAVEAPFWERLDKLSPQLQRPEGQYLELVNALAKERKAAIEALALRLTREALGQVTGA
nr:NEL-type E3 ubiquitin ligase domain-containing protein [uncultured Pseudomonas sp.]